MIDVKNNRLLVSRDKIEDQSTSSGIVLDSKKLKVERGTVLFSPEASDYSPGDKLSWTLGASKLLSSSPDVYYISELDVIYSGEL